MSLKQFIALTSFALATLATTACTSGSSNSMVSNLKLTTTQVNGDLNVNAIAELNTGSIQLMPSAISIINPKKPSQVLGQLSVLSGLTTGGFELQLSVDVNKALAAGGQVSDVTLPNGTTIPISGINPSNWVTIPVGAANSYLYLNVDSVNKKAVIGVAMDIEAISAGVAGDAFIPFMFNNVTGLAGIFTGTLPNTSGIATFVDISASLTSLGAFGAASFHEQYHNLNLIQEHLDNMQRFGRKLKLR